MLQGNIPVIPTPFRNGEIDYDSLDRFMEHVKGTLDGVVVGGSTGEAQMLSSWERKQLTRYICGKLPADQTVVVGLGHTSLIDAIDIGSDAKEAGVRYALVPSPYYFPNSLEMVIDYVRRLADRTGLEIVFYDNPVTTKSMFTAEELVSIAAAVPQIKAVKMTDHHFGKIRHLKANTGLAVFGGDDIICFRSFEAGVDGNMIIAPIVYPAEFRECWNLYRRGKRTESFRMYCDVLLPFISMFGPGDEIPTTKALFKELGIYSSAETRSPLLVSNEQRVSETMLGYQAGLQAGLKS